MAKEKDPKDVERWQIEDEFKEFDNPNLSRPATAPKRHPMQNRGPLASALPPLAVFGGIHSDPYRLIARGQTLPTQWDRQVDEFDSPGISSGGGGSTAAIYPFDVISAGTSNFTVQPGTINGILPSNYSNVFTLSLGTTYYVDLNVTASSGQVTAATLSFDASAPAAIPVNASAPPNSFSFMLGLLITDNVGGATWYRVIGPGSLTAAGSLVYQVNASSPSPGTLPFTNYYTWLMGQF